MVSVEIDDGGLIADLTRAAALVERDVEQVVSRGALNVKRQLVDEMRGSRHFKAAAQSIDYTLTTGAASAEAEIGPRSGAGEPGNLANIAYFGTSRGGGTVPDPSVALAAELPRFERALLALIDKAVM